MKTFKNIVPWAVIIVFACFLQYCILHPQPLSESQIINLIATVAAATVVILGLGVLQILMYILSLLIRFDIWRMTEKENYGWLRPSSVAGPRLN